MSFWFDPGLRPSTGLGYGLRERAVIRTGKRRENPGGVGIRKEREGNRSCASLYARILMLGWRAGRGGREKVRAMGGLYIG